MSDPTLISLVEAARRLGVSRVMMARLVKAGRFTITDDPAGGCHKVVDAAQIAEESRARFRGKSLTRVTKT